MKIQFVESKDWRGGGGVVDLLFYCTCMRKLPSRYRAGQSSIPSSAQDDDGNLVKESSSSTTASLNNVSNAATAKPPASVIKVAFSFLFFFLYSNFSLV